jgi:hypothetical protein
MWEGGARQTQPKWCPLTQQRRKCYTRTVSIARNAHEEHARHALTVVDDVQHRHSKLLLPSKRHPKR